MRKILLLLYVGVTLINWAQDEHDYYHYPVHYPDTTTEIVFSAEKPLGRWGDDECWKAQSYHRVSGYRKYMDSIELDSALYIFKKLSQPLLGNRVFKRTHLYRVDQYNKGKNYRLDSSAVQHYKENAPDCLKLQWKFECYFMFEDSIWFPFEIHIDNKGRLIKASSIIKTLQTMEDYHLKAPEYIFKKANRDPFMKGHPTRKYFDLAYSEHLHYFYFTSYSHREEKILAETNYSSLTLHRHIFLDAKTGNILWRVKVEHFYEHIGCVIRSDFRFPDNTLME